MNLAGRTFRAVANSKNGSLNTETEMRFTSDDGIVVGNYSGGTIAAGHALGKRLGESELEMLYQGATTSGEVKAGKAHARFTPDSEGLIDTGIVRTVREKQEGCRDRAPGVVLSPTSI